MPARLRVRSCGFALLGAACGVLPVAGQTQLEVAPYVGRYQPTNVLGSGGGVTLKHLGSTTLGMRVTLWLPGRLGLEGTLGYAPSRLWSNDLGLARAHHAHVLTRSAKALLRLTPPAARAALHVGGGVGRVGHGGSQDQQDNAYPPWYVGRTDFLSGIVNVGASIKLTRWMAVRFDVEDFVYSAYVGSCTRNPVSASGVCDIWDNAVLHGFTATPTASVVQNDLVLSFGIAFACCPSGSRSQ